MVRAKFLLQISGGFSQLLSFKGRGYIVRLKVGLTIRDLTHQAGLEGFQFSPTAEITENICRCGIAVISWSSLKSCLLQCLH